MKIKPYTQPIVPNNNGRQFQQFPNIYSDPPYEEEGSKLDLRQILGVLRRRFLVVATVAIGVASVVGTRTWNSQPQYIGSFRVLVEPITAETKVAQTFGAIVYSILDYDTQTEVLRSPSVMTPIIEKIKAKYPEITYESLIGNLIITRLGQTKIIEVRYQDVDSKKINDVLQQVADGYLSYSRTERQSDVRQGIDFVQEQLPNLRLRVDTLQARLQKFRQQYNFIDPETKAQELSGRMNGISQEQSNTKTRLDEMRSLYGTLQGQLGLQPNEAILASALSEASRYQKLLSEFQDVETKLAVESVRFTPENPTILALKEQREKLLPLINKEAQRVLGNNLSPATINRERLTYQNSIRLSLTQQFVDTTNQIKVLEVRNKALDQASALLIREFQQMPIRAREYTDLKRELEVSTDSLLRFLSSRESLEIEAAQKATPWKLINTPDAAVVISPSKYRNIMLGVIAGLILGAGAAWLAEMLDSVFHSVDDLKEKSGMPILGIVPFHKSVKKLFPVTETARILAGENQKNAPADSNLRRYNASPFVEAFRSLYTNVRLLSSDLPIRSLVISSSTPAEGKTLVALNLAQAAAAMGQRVLLVDADLRRPQVHERFGLTNMRGLSNLISAEDLDINDVIQQSPLEENLFVMTSGQVPPDPTRLLSSEKMQNIMAQLQTAFNLIIYDTPPLLGFADANILGTTTDGVVLVVGLGKTDRYSLMQTIEGLKMSGTPVLGMVANGVKKNTVHWHDSYNRYYTQTAEKGLGARG
ncbi:GumC family protein [Argonema antarcticum]|uniref:GumC family protein n=1 Tax=Argonema antarcticum TaxID=2942763 RepID=UPI002012E8D1|nr:polysaccharide biosynthesis tyrosine autokinase [Argonema antarcticum]MCL1471263.1 polysaccharide biosynthesis tyrosine autokinase [Argonema antarcticum A004/B2]